MPARSISIILALLTSSVSLAVAAQTTDEPFSLTTPLLAAEYSDQPTAPPSAQPSMFRDPDDGYFDVSNFLSTRVGFLPIAMPITEPAVGYGLSLGLTFFHDRPQVVNYPGQPPRVIMPSMTVLFGAGTESGTWAAGLGHVGVWNGGKIRYLGAAGYTDLQLDWFGRGDSLGGRSISYANDVLFLYQKVTFKLGDTDFFLGPQYRLLATD